MPIDSQVVNGRFVGADRSDVTSLEIDQGQFVSVDGDAEAWRTVDASGYYVLPGAVQMSDAGPTDAFQMVLQGITSLVVPVECGVQKLADEIDRLKSDSVLDTAICWTPPASVTRKDVRTAGEHGIHIFDVTSLEPNQALLGELADVTLRVSTQSPNVHGWLASPESTRVVLTQIDAEGLASAQTAKRSRSAGVFLETDLKDDQLWEAIVSGKIDLINRTGSGEGLLQTLYAEGVIQRGLSMSRLVELCAVAPSKAYGLTPRKGSLNAGSDADFVVFDPDQMSGLNGVDVSGRVVYAQLRGEILLFNGELHLAPGDGQVL